MMTEEFPPLPVSAQLTASPPCPVTSAADTNDSCPLKVVEAGDSTQRSPKFGRRYSSFDIESTENVPEMRHQPNGTSRDKGLARAQSCPNGSDPNHVIRSQKAKYRGLPDGEAPILYDYESTSRYPNNNNNNNNNNNYTNHGYVFSPEAHSCQARNARIDILPNLDDTFPDVENGSERPQCIGNNGDVVFISEDAKAERKRASNVRSQSIKGTEAAEGSTRHPPVIRANSEPIAADIRASSSRTNLDLGKLTSLCQEFLQSPITCAILLGDSTKTLEGIEQGDNPCLVCSTSGSTLFHLVAQASTADRELAWVPMVFQLSNAGADPNVKDADGVTAVGIAISRKLVQIVAALLKCGAEINADDMFQAEQIRGVVKSELMETIRRLTPSYWSAVHDLTPFKVNRLVKAWARVNVTRHGLTLIEYAKQHARDVTIVQLLLRNEASIELAHAVMAGDLGRVKACLCHGAVDLTTSDTSVKNNYFEPFAPLTLYGAALKLGHVAVLNELKAAQNRTRYGASSSSSSSNSNGNGNSNNANNNTNNGSGNNSSSRSSNAMTVFGASSSGSISGACGYYGNAGSSSSGNNNNNNVGPGHGRMRDTTVVFYKGSSNEEICEIRNASTPVSSALCAIV